MIASAPHDRGAAPPASPAAPAPFGLLSLALASALARETRALEQLQAIEATPRPNGRSAGAEWPVEELAQTVRLIREAHALIAALAPREAEVRALLGHA